MWRIPWFSLLCNMFFQLLGVCCLIQLPDSTANISEAPLVLSHSLFSHSDPCSLCYSLKPGCSDLLVADGLALQLQRRAELTMAFAYGKALSVLPGGNDLRAHLPC